MRLNSWSFYSALYADGLDQRHRTYNIKIIFIFYLFLSFNQEEKSTIFEEITFLFIAYYLWDILLCCETKQIFNMVDWMNVWMDVIFLENIQKRAYGEKFFFLSFLFQNLQNTLLGKCFDGSCFRFYLSYIWNGGRSIFLFILFYIYVECMEYVRIYSAPYVFRYIHTVCLKSYFWLKWRPFWRKFIIIVSGCITYWKYVCYVEMILRVFNVKMENILGVEVVL